MPGIIDGRRWLTERRRHLEAELAKDLTEARRLTVEAELARLRVEAGTNRRRRWWRFWGFRPPGL